jgi:Type II secretion system (T2SS), protein E, N-terminal domain
MKSLVDYFRPAAGRSWKNLRSTCALQTCRNTLLIRSVPQSRVGITVGDQWYCSVDCFAAASRPRLATLSDGRVTEMPHSPRLSIGLVMLSKGYLTDDQLRFAMTQSQIHGENLESALVRLGLAGERQLAAARAAQWGYPIFGQDRISQSVEVDIPTVLLTACSAAPLHYSPVAKRFLLGFVYRVEYSLLQALEQVTGFRAEPCFITPTDFADQMGRVTAVSGYQEVVIEDQKTPAQMSKTIGGFAVEIGAREARFAQCRNHVWTRLSGKKNTVDILFRTRPATSLSVPVSASVPTPAPVPEPVVLRNSVPVKDTVSSLG